MLIEDQRPRGHIWVASFLGSLSNSLRTLKIKIKQTNQKKKKRAKKKEKEKNLSAVHCKERLCNRKSTALPLADYFRILFSKTCDHIILHSKEKLGLQTALVLLTSLR